MGENKKYFWFQLKEDFFRNKEIKKLRRRDDGDTLIVLYLEMILLSLKNGGKILFEGIEDSLAEEIALDTDSDVETVERLLEFLDGHNMAEINDDQDEITLTRAAESIQTESESAERVRRHRERKKQEKLLHCNVDVTDVTLHPLHVTDSVTNCNTEIEIEKEIELNPELNLETNPELNLEKQLDSPALKIPAHGDSEPSAAAETIEPEKPPVFRMPLNDKTEFGVLQSDVDRWAELYPAVDVLQELREMVGWLESNPTKRKTRRGIRTFITNWLSREQDKPHIGGSKKGRGTNAQPDTDNPFLQLLWEQRQQDTTESAEGGEYQIIPGLEGVL